MSPAAAGACTRCDLKLASFGFELIPQPSDGGGIGDAESLDGCGRLQLRICIHQLSDSAQLCAIIEPAASRSAAAAISRRHNPASIHHDSIAMNLDKFRTALPRRKMSNDK
jgi:hypothetical protein